MEFKLLDGFYRCRKGTEGEELTNMNIVVESSSLSEYKSVINSGSAVKISIPLCWAVLSLLKGNAKVSELNKTKDYFFVEVQSNSDKSKKYYVNNGFDTTDRLEKTFCYSEDKELIGMKGTTKYVHYSVLIPTICRLIKKDEYFKDYYENAKIGLKTNDNELLKKSLFQMTDYIYHSRNDESLNINQNLEVNSSIETLVGKGKDITKEYVVEESVLGTSKAPNTVTDTDVDIDTTRFMLPKNSSMPKELEELVPNLKGLFMTDFARKTLNKIKRRFNTENPLNTILLYGGAGASKSTVCKIWAGTMGLPYVTINGSTNMEEDKFIGKLMPSTDGSESFMYQYSDFTKAFKYGGVVELCEPNYSKEGVIGVLNSALDDNGLLILDNGEIIERHPNFFMVVTTNLDYVGCRDMNQAFKSRFKQMIRLDRLETDVLVKVIKQKSGLNDEIIIRKMIDAMDKISKKIEEEGYNGVCGTREIINWATDYIDEMDILSSANNTILSQASSSYEDQQSIVDTILANIFKIR